jgi:enoyl-[acyl-carrier protein] reductase II
LDEPAYTFDNRITRMLGIDIPITNAPMGGVAGPELVAAVSEAGAMGLVPGSLARVAPEILPRFIQAMKENVRRPFGVNLPVAFVTEAAIIDQVLESGVRFLTTSTGPVSKHTARLQQRGITVFHVVTSLQTAKLAADAGVDGLIVEGSEGGGLRGEHEIPLMVLLPLITSRIDLPVIAAGGISDGRTMAAAVALGAEGVQMGTRLLASRESEVHETLKQAVVAADETESIIINRHHQRPLRVLRTETTEKYQNPSTGDAFKELSRDVLRLYREGDLLSGFASLGQVMGRVDEVLPVAEIVADAVKEFSETIAHLSTGLRA